ncbi:MAG TPA: Gfo/Idh/MocA family oxidoreductase [Verrucomicrobiae bacterium]|nr:Gfo/Idh/MocA family oxidoreductase [Verrucomicrobiae bacterium]
MNPAPKHTRVATIGAFGHWGCVLDEIATVNGIEVIAAACALPGESVDRVVAHPGVSKSVNVFDDYRLMLKSVRPDVVVVSCRLDRIPVIALDAANAGCDIICEKPLALDTPALEKLYRGLSNHGTRLMAMLSMRADPVFQKARELYQSGAIGEVTVVNAQKSYKYGDREEWFGVRDTYGGTMLWVGIHALDMIHFTTGQAFTSVAAFQRNFAHPSRPDCEDYVAAILGLENGGAATVSIDLFRPEAAATHGDDWIRIVGTEGILEARSNDRVIRLLRENADAQTIAVDTARPIYTPFLSGVTGDDESLMRPEDPFLLTHACLCARDAADAGVVEQIPAMPWSRNASVQARSS